MGSEMCIRDSLKNWYGEPAKATRSEFYRQARLMKIDSLRSKPDVEPLSDRLWRRYGRRAFSMLEAIRDDPRMGEDIMENADYLRVELHLAASTEMVTKLEDFMRRRSKIEQVVPNADLGDTEGLREVCDILFGDEAEAKLNEFLAGPYGQPGPGQSVAAPSAVSCASSYGPGLRQLHGTTCEGSLRSAG